MNAQCTSLDVLYLTLALGISIAVGGFMFLVVKVHNTLIHLNTLIMHVDSTARDVQSAKNLVKRSALMTVATVLNTFVRKGK